mmetsp:Transcript_104470/g.248569  ORF Transcript_104470/g.248569 Transcript_104470/m.248569 type:complete len:233 (-) Transcript_104470:63-761(-)
MHQLVIHLNPEALCVQKQTLVINHAMELEAIEGLADLRSTCVLQLLYEVEMKHQPQDAGKGLNVLKLLFCQERLQFGNLLHFHREEVCAHSQDTMQKQHPRRVILEMREGVLVAKLEMIYEGPVSMLHREIALVSHEIKYCLVHGGRLGQCYKVLLDLAGDGVGPKDLNGQPISGDHSGNGAVQFSKYRLVQVESLGRTDNDILRMVGGLPARNLGFAPIIQRPFHLHQAES